MADESRTEEAQKVAPPVTHDQDAAQAQALVDHPKLAEALAEKVRGMVNEALKGIVGAETQERIKRAAQTVDRQKVTVASFNTPDSQAGAGLTKEQKGELFRCMVHRLNGSVHIAPRAELDDGGRLTQALNPITDASGAYLLPQEFVPEVEWKAPEPIKIWPMLTKRPSKQRYVLKPEITTYVSANTGTSANVNSATTATEITETVPVYSQLEWHLEDMDTRIPIKLDLLEESPVDVMDECMRQITDAFNIQRERLPILGRGHTTYKEPIGLLDATAAITTVAISATPTVDLVLDFISNVPQRYRAGAALVAPSTTFFKVASVLAQNVNAPEFLTKVGALPPMVESGYITEGKLLAGDFSRYVVYYIRLMQVIKSIAAERKTIELVVTETWTGQPTIADAFRIATGVAYT